jgi:hypothetical protein
MRKSDPVTSEVARVDVFTSSAFGTFFRWEKGIKSKEEA